MKHIPKKRFGQNFLTDQNVLHEIIRAIAPQPDDLMVEIGPGQGAMTRLLLAQLKHLQVVELDRDLVVLLKKQFSTDQLQIHAGDALQFDFGALAKEVANNDTFGDTARRLRVVGNLPYNISSPLLFHLAAYADQVIDQHFMLQEEVIERMVAAPGSRDFGRLSVMLQWRYRMDLLFIVPPEAFDPPPRVDSAIVRMVPIEQPMACEQALLEQVVTKAFSQRRKVIRNCLSGMFTELELVDAGINPRDRPEAVGLEPYVNLARRLAQRAGSAA
jgi:16S rRNA (adenine1518-N6/adenine1519-N6)-dimethyltransferase